MRELYWAVTARRRDAWDQTSQVLAFIATHGGQKHVNALDYHPYRRGGRKGGSWAEVFGAGKRIVAERKRRREKRG